MADRIFDTNKLISQWRRSRERPIAEYGASDAGAWADELVALHQTDWIVTPVYLEFVGGAIGGHEMSLTRAFLGRFTIADGGRITPEDWVLARRLAGRIPRGPRPAPRGAMDCLIKSIAVRLRCILLTEDQGMPRT